MQLDLALRDGRTAHLRLSDALTIALDPTRIYTIDLSGRLIGIFRQGKNIRRGLDGRMLARWREGRGARQRLWLDQRAILALLNQLAIDLDTLLLVNPPQPIVRVLQLALDFDYQADSERFHQTYHPISILPPDQYQALVLQATEGCSFNTCTFCALYRDRPFRIKQPAEFAQHIQQAQRFFGAGIRLRRSIFLADANALIIPQARLLPLFDEIDKAFPLMPATTRPEQRRAWLHKHPAGITGIYAFVDGLSAEHKSVDEFRKLRQRGIRRVYIGLESGSETLLAWLRKPSSAEAMTAAIVRLKQARINVGVIVLTGIGGQRHNISHCADTAAVLNAMPLDGNDIIYFSPFQPDPDSPYEAIAKEEGIEPPSMAFRQQQEQQIRATLTLPPPPKGPKCVPYNLHDFVY